MLNFIKTLAGVAFATMLSVPAFAQQQACCDTAHKVKIAAHRGFWKSEAAGMAQNSIASLKAAQDNGFWGSEMDIHLTKDNVIVVNHDETINGINIQKSNYVEIQNQMLKNGEKISTFDAYLTQTEKCPTTKLVVEFKSQGSKERDYKIVDIAMEQIKAHNLYCPMRVMFISFSLDACKRVAEVAPEFTNQYLEGDLSPKELKEMNINGIDYEYSILLKKPEWIKEAHELGMSVNAWTVNKEGDMKQLIEYGVDCLTTNEPLLAKQLLGDKEDKITCPMDSCDMQKKDCTDDMKCEMKEMDCCKDGKACDMHKKEMDCCKDGKACDMHKKEMDCCKDGKTCDMHKKEMDCCKDGKACDMHKKEMDCCKDGKACDMNKKKMDCCKDGKTCDMHKKDVKKEKKSCCKK